MYFITVRQLAEAVNNLQRIPVESVLIKPETEQGNQEETETEESEK